jgi:hypothetical protein
MPFSRWTTEVGSNLLRTGPGGSRDLLTARQEVCSPSVDHNPLERETPDCDLLSRFQDDLLI